MVIGPLDKNLGECWVACPHIYEQAVDKIMDKMYATDAGYKRVYPYKDTVTRRRKPGNPLENIWSESSPPVRSQGEFCDVLKVCVCV